MLNRSTPMKRTELRRSTGESTASTPVFRPKVCSKAKGGCGLKFTPSRPMQVACGADCAYSIGMRNRLKMDKAADKVRAERLLTLSDWRKRAQAAFNGWVRARDEAAGLPCISCQRHHQGSHDAGHYLSTGARPELRFDEANTHRQCVPCNQHLHGNIAMYRVGLIARIGLAEVERLEGPNPLRHDTADSLKELAAHYRARTRELKKSQG